MIELAPPVAGGRPRQRPGGNVLAGLALAAIAIPEQLATARLGGLAPELGLLAFVIGTLIFAVAGSNRLLSVGADSTIAPIFAGALALLAAPGDPRYAGLAALLALLVGLLLTLAGVLRAGWIADLLSIPVTVGFLAGVSAHILIGQLPTILGVPGGHGYLLAELFTTLRQLPQARPVAAGLAGFVLLCALASERFAPRLPGALIGLIGAAIAVRLLGLHVAMLDAVVARVPVAALPPLGLRDVVALLPLALTVTLVCMMQTAAVLRAFPGPDGEASDASRDFLGLGLGNVVAGLFGAFAVNASPPRTALVAETGGTSQRAGLVAVLVVIGLVFLAGGVVALLPAAALSGVLVFIALRILRIGEMRAIALAADGEIWLVAASAALVVALPIELGVALSIVLSLMHSLFMLTRPPCSELSRLPGTTIWWDEPGERVAGVKVLAVAAPVVFANAGHIQRQLRLAVARPAGRPGPAAPALLVIEASGATLIDYTGARMLIRLVATLRAAGTDIAIARLGADHAQAAASRSGLLAALGADHLFHSVEEAVHTLAPKP
ncbi:MAG: SulP family inorganic anion transporter [Rhodospirillales bacterium]|nr:SulP family inorganic anion transporter [Rhodospirillales bacterium]MDE2575015.1 SulP family inorganic anion transporter [Rhodospirillales bacterium]